MKKLWKIIKSPGAMAVVAIVSLGIAILQSYDEKKPKLLVKIEATSSVFSVFQPVGGLEVSYAGQDLRGSKQALWVVTASISNNGSAVIRKDDYDDSVPLSINVTDGEIVETPDITSENSYLQENLKPVVASNRIVFSPVIFEPNDVFRLRILVLGPEGKVPSLKLIAKIAGLNDISYATPDSPNASKSVWEMITQADALWVHLARVVVYFFGGLFTLIVIMMIGTGIGSNFSTIGENRDKKKRSESVKDYRQGVNMDWEDRALVELYIAHGEQVLREIKHLTDRSKSRLALVDKLKPINEDGQLDGVIKSVTPFYSSPLLADLTKRELFSFDGIRPQWVTGFESAFNDICSFLGLNLAKPAKDAHGERAVQTGNRPQDSDDADPLPLAVQSKLD